MRYLSVFREDSEILKAISDIHLRGEWFDLDCTYSKGVFYKDIPQPKYKSDIEPLFDDVMKIDATEMNGIANDAFNSIVFDPPFLFRKRKSVNNDKICARFSYFTSYEELVEMYKKSLNQFKRVLKKGGYLCFKCQDMTDNKFYCTHNFIINYARDIGFELKDIIIKATTQKLQREAKQQNCVAKVHSYWLIFKNKKVEK
jgi:DNA modification methylase